MKLILYPYISKEPSEEGNLGRTDIKVQLMAAPFCCLLEEASYYSTVTKPIYRGFWHPSSPIHGCQDLHRR
ncbi:hypothetical protein D3C76_1615480 [compost metagenome]